jgi:hypothetical protein
MEPKHFYTIKWSQPYTFGVSLEELDALMEQLIELDMEAGNMQEAAEVINMIMKK